MQADGTWSSRRINRFAKLLVDPTSYLEIGVEEGRTFEAVALPHRVAVDPNPLFSCTHLPSGVSVNVKTSDQFFEELEAGVTFDLVFLDGLHTFDQTYRDVMNSLHHTYTRSVILVDDVVPSDAISAMRDLRGAIAERARIKSNDSRWHGDVFRLMLVLQDHHPELNFRTIVNGSDNEQAVIWKADPIVISKSLNDADLEVYKHRSYSDVFSNGIPDFFRPGTEEEIVQDVMRSMQ